MIMLYTVTWLILEDFTDRCWQLLFYEVFSSFVQISSSTNHLVLEAIARQMSVCHTAHSGVVTR